MLSGNLSGTYRSCDSHHGKRSYVLPSHLSGAYSSLGESTYIFHVLLQTLSFSLLWWVGIPNFIEGNSFVFYPQGFSRSATKLSMILSWSLLVMRDIYSIG